MQKNSENESVVGLLMIGFWSFMVQLGVAVRWKYTAYVNISEDLFLWALFGIWIAGWIVFYIELHRVGFSVTAILSTKSLD